MHTFQDYWNKQERILLSANTIAYRCQKSLDNTMSEWLTLLWSIDIAVEEEPK